MMFLSFLGLMDKKKNILDSKKNYVQGVKYVLPRSIPTVYNTDKFITLKNRFVVFSGSNASYAI